MGGESDTAADMHRSCGQVEAGGVDEGNGKAGEMQAGKTGKERWRRRCRIKINDTWGLLINNIASLLHW
jgi:hypothetical protein